MPTYEYECGQCGKHFDYFHSMSEPPKAVCEECGGALTKLLSPGAGLIFKGSGFYITDYKNKGSESASSSSSSESKPASTESKGTSETKKSDSKPVESSSSPQTSTTNSNKAD
jgi:putative FmdB family regulatory protein